mgnify:CR=1 FL=1
MGKRDGLNTDLENHISYIFIPFRYEGEGIGQSLPDALNASGDWNQVDDEIEYMLRYVADRIEGKDSGKNRYEHFIFEDQQSVSGMEGLFYTEKHLFNGVETEFGFRIQSIQLFYFSTSVSVMAFGLHFECSADSLGCGEDMGENLSMEAEGETELLPEQLLYISSAQYYLKKVSREKIHRAGGSDTTLLGIAKEIMDRLGLAGDFDFFFYAKPGTERANLFTYLEACHREGFEYELFYLRRCYNEKYLYHRDEKRDEQEIFKAAENITWGLSREAAVCITCPSKGGRDFLHNVFFGNFNRQYLFMYVLLLHQKYVLYLFQTRINAELYEDLDTLETYRNNLYKFETDFVYSRVTEVSQYQELYDRMTQAFALKEMYEDVREPLQVLVDARSAELEKSQKRAEQEQKKKEEKMNKILFIISVVCALPVVSDIFEIIEFILELFLGRGLNEFELLVVRGLCPGAVLLILVLVLLSMAVSNLFNKKRD